MDKKQEQIIDFLSDKFSSISRQLQPTSGTGHESYFGANGNKQLFIKIGANVERYQLMAADDLTPTVLASGELPNGQTILVQQKINGRTPTRQDFQTHLPAFAHVLGQAHQHPDLRDELLPPVSESYEDMGQLAFENLLKKWNIYRPQVPTLAQTIDQKLDRLQDTLSELSGGGTIASHNDVCNANWLMTPENKVYLIDLDSMSMDDPAVDLGALLWWYYPPDMRERFCDLAGYEFDEQLQTGMRVRMAMHCLNILLPRENSFDRFDPAGFTHQIVDFFAAADGKQNPQGYD